MNHDSLSALRAVLYIALAVHAWNDPVYQHLLACIAWTYIMEAYFQERE